MKYSYLWCYDNEGIPLFLNALNSWSEDFAEAARFSECEAKHMAITLTNSRRDYGWEAPRVRVGEAPGE